MTLCLSGEEKVISMHRFHYQQLLSFKLVGAN